MSKKAWRVIKAPSSPCVECGHVMDYCTGPKGNPEPGAFTLCIRCGSLNIFDEDMKLRSPTLDEYVESTKMPDIQKGRNAIIKINEERKSRT